MTHDAAGSPDSKNASASLLQIETDRRGATIVLKVSGAAAAELAGQLSRALQEAAQEQPRLLAVDLSELVFVSSSGLGALIAAHVTCQKSDTKMCLISLRSPIAEALETTKLSTLLTICETLEEAEQLAGGA